MWVVVNIFLYTEWLVIYVAQVQFLSYVRPLSCRNVASLIERLVEYVIQTRILSRVRERPFTGVFSECNLDWVTCRKCLTGKISFTCGDPLVYRQLAFSIEQFIVIPSHVRSVATDRIVHSNVLNLYLEILVLSL